MQIFTHFSPDTTERFNAAVRLAMTTPEQDSAGNRRRAVSANGASAQSVVHRLYSKVPSKTGTRSPGMGKVRDELFRQKSEGDVFVQKKHVDAVEGSDDVQGHDDCT